MARRPRTTAPGGSPERVDAKEIIATCEPARVVELLCKRGTFPAALLEPVYNSIDAGASRIEITFDPEHRRLRIADDGRGFDWDGIRSFYSIGDSPKNNLKGTIGLHGTGRLFMLGEYCEAITASTRGAYCPKGHARFVLRKETLERLVVPAGCRLDVTSEVSIFSGTPEGWLDGASTGSVIDYQLLPKVALTMPAKLISHLAHRLPFLRLDDVRVNGAPLSAAMESVIEPLVIDEHDPLLGRVLVALLMPKVKSQLVIGGLAPFMRFQDFYDALPEECQELVPEALLSIPFAGQFCFEALRDFRANDSASATAELLQERDLLDAICEFLRDVVGPRLDAVVEALKREQKSADASKGFEQIFRAFPAVRLASGFPKDAAGEGGRTQGNAPITLAPRFTQTTVGEEVELTAYDPTGRSATFEWMCRGASVEIVRTTATTILVRSVAPGATSVYAIDPAQARRFARATVNVNARGAYLWIGQRTSRLTLGSEPREYAIESHSPGILGVVWQAFDAATSRPLQSDDGVIVTSTGPFTADVSLTHGLRGYEQVWLRAEAVGDSAVRDEVPITVRYPPQQAIRIEDRKYVLEKGFGAAIAEVRSASDVGRDGRGKVYRLAINFDCPIIEAYRTWLERNDGEGTRDVLVHYGMFLAHHIQKLLEDGQDEFAREVTDLHERIISMMEQQLTR